jgi:O-succinylbenzoic acid--CoA ligase
LQSSINLTQDWLEARANISPKKLHIGSMEGVKSHFLTFTNRRRYAPMQCKANIFLGTTQKLGLLVPSNLRTIYTIFALIRLGVTLVPLNTRLSPQEINFQVKNADCDYILYHEDYEEKASHIDLDASRIMSIFDVCKTNKMQTFPTTDIELDRPFAIIHTSGTSGQPKGAVLTYNNIYQSAMASAYRIGVMPDDRWLCVLPLFHVGGLSIILRSLLYGTAVDLMPKFDVDAVNQALTHRPITLVSLVPTMLHRLLEARTEAWNPKLRLVLLGGAAPSPELVQRCVEEGIPLATTYGLSEASSQVATATLEQVVKKPASVGKPLMFTQVRVVDENSDEMLPNEIGEIIVKGPTVMQGYYNNPKATAKTLRDGWLYTGDMGYKDDDGDLFVVQRRSDLIVTGGENVYPVEVENVIRQHPDVKEVVVVGLDDAEWGQRVAAAIQLMDGTNLSPDEIIQFARDHLAGYKIPREIRFVTDFQQTSSGKIQHNEVKKVFDNDC